MTAAVDYATVGDYIVALTNNNLALLNAELEVVTISPIPVVSCKHMVYETMSGLFLFCTSSNTTSGQLILGYSIEGTEFKLQSAYELPNEHIIQHFD